MIFWVYNILLILLSPLWVPWMLWRAAQRMEKPDWRQRTGDLPIEPPKKGVRRAWFHAVSVGEVMAAVPVLKEVRDLDPGLEIVLSTTTSSGQAAAEEKAEGLFDQLVYFPIDVPRFVVAAMIRVRPKVVAITETELWMNFLWAAKEFRAKTILINGRISQRSFVRSSSIRGYYRSLFKNLDQAYVQTEMDALHFKALGFAEPEIVGNTKYDGAIQDAQTEKDWRNELDIPFEARVIVIGSTRSDAEEQLVGAALDKLDLDDSQDVWVVHAPRHIERAEQLAEQYRGRYGHAALRSRQETGRFLVLDTYGELGGLYSAADIVVVGGGFDDLGGQNIIQPLAHGKPVIHGPYMQNFREIADSAVTSGASRVASTAEELACQLREMLSDGGLRSQMGDAAKNLVETNVGASRRCAEAVVEAARAD